MLNPFYWITSNQDWLTAKEDFRYQQNSDKYNSRYYPFTPDHPYDPWYSRLRYKLFGESIAEYTSRQRKVEATLSKIQAKIRTAEGFSPAQSVVSLGIGAQNLSGSPFLSEVGLASASGLVRDKLSSIPTTPITDPSALPVLQSESPGWKSITTGVVARNNPSAIINPSLPMPAYSFIYINI